jgi:hypothetical protein
LFTGKWFDGAYLVKSQNPLFAGVETQVEKDVQMEIKEAVSQTQVTDANALLPTLHQLVDFVDNLAVSFEPLLRNVYERNNYVFPIISNSAACYDVARSKGYENGSQSEYPEPDRQE